jgi:hypothetical protein
MAKEAAYSLVEDLGLTGLVGVRAIVSFAGRFYSPVYGHCEWTRGMQQASCAIGCTNVPGDHHLGCGFHAHWEVDESKRFVEQIRGTADCLVLVECFGRLAVHEKGFRAEQARIVSVLEWDPRFKFFVSPWGGRPSASPVPLTASKYFGVPLVNESAAAAAIAQQRQSVVV